MFINRRMNRSLQTELGGVVLTRINRVSSNATFYKKTKFLYWFLRTNHVEDDTKILLTSDDNHETQILRI